VKSIFSSCAQRTTSYNFHNTSEQGSFKKKTSQHFRYLKAAAYEGKVILGTSLGFYHMEHIKMGDESSTNLSTLIYPLRQSSSSEDELCILNLRLFHVLHFAYQNGSGQAEKNEILGTCSRIGGFSLPECHTGALSKKHQLNRINRSVFFTWS